MDDFLKFILGAVSALAGSVITQILQARYAGKKKSDEIVAEKQIAACTDAYIMMKRVQSMLSTWTHIFAHFFSAILSNINGKPVRKTCENFCPGT